MKAITTIMTECFSEGSSQAVTMVTRENLEPVVSFIFFSPHCSLDLKVALGKTSRSL